MDLKVGDGSAITKADVNELFKQFTLMSAEVLVHPKFDDESRQLAIHQTSTYIIVLKELFDATATESIDDANVGVVINAAKYLKFINSFVTSA